jgi:hypothetical protein
MVAGVADRAFAAQVTGHRPADTRRRSSPAAFASRHRPDPSAARPGEPDPCSPRHREVASK